MYSSGAMFLPHLEAILKQMARCLNNGNTETILVFSLHNNHVILIFREAAIWCLSALHGLGQTLWFPAVPK